MASSRTALPWAVLALMTLSAAPLLLPPCDAAADSLEECGLVFSAQQFLLRSPRRPANSTCSYVVRRHSPLVDRLQLHVRRFDGWDCEEGAAELMVGGRRLCGSGGDPRTFPLHRRGLVISYRSGPHTDGRGFEAVARQMDGATSRRPELCHVEHSAAAVLLASSPTPSDQPGDAAACVHVFRQASPRQCLLEIHFLRFSLEDTPGCARERLEIVGHEILCGNVTGSRSYRWTDGELRLRFAAGRAGFLISVRQVECDADDNIIATDDSGISEDDRPREERPSTTSSCGKVYSGKAFVVTSPGFPRGVRLDGDCVFVVRRRGPDVCRLRMVLKYFCVGKEDSHAGCHGGYLEVDGRRICGCQTGRTLVSLFDPAVDEDQKMLKYVSREVQAPPLEGFVIEVRQETCFSIEKTKTDETQFYNSSTTPVSLVRIDEYLGQLTSNSTIISKKGRGDNSDKHNISEISQDNQNKGANPVSSAGIKERPRRSPGTSNLWQCNLKTWFRLVEEVFRKNAGTPLCPVPQPSSCQSTNALEGTIQSPNYPGPYPSNLRCCYRIWRRAGYCRVQVTMLDFDVELSTGCVRDYVVLGDSGRYCGASLAATTSYLDTSTRGYADVLFASDAGGAAGRGFKAAFRQLACTAQGGGGATPTTTTLAPTAAWWPPTYYCGDVFAGQQFVLVGGRYPLSLSACTFRVLRASQEVCELQISMERFNLTCGQESLQIGSQFYCGLLTGNYVSTKFSDSEVQIVYRKSTVDSPGEFVLSGQQVADCATFSLNVTPAARIQGTSCSVVLGPPRGSRGFPLSGDPQDCSYVFEQRPGACGVRLVFDGFQARSAQGCAGEFLELEGRKFCGGQLLNHSREILFGGSDIQVPYLVEEGDKSSNWHFSYSYVSC